MTRAEAANFYYGIRLLDRDRRRAMCAVYAFARRVDDIGDGTLAVTSKLERLDREDSALSALTNPQAASVGRASATGAEDPVMVALADANVRFSLPEGVLGELIEGVRMDVAGVSYETFEELVLYCRRVAGAIGRVCLAIFGLRADAPVDMAHAQVLADDLGVALQLTNILRDVREDAQNDRVYLPAEDLGRFAVLDGGGLDGAPGRLSALAESAAAGDRNSELEQIYELMRFEAERAREWFQRGLALGGLLDRRSAACVLAMAGIYRRLLDRIEADPERAFTRRVSLPGYEKAWVAARGMVRGGA
ncbi:MAG TPA: squalene/phytoene synthase family protein [Solirubrobacteraceae bacterium]|nr:squalene/phytoene synthase family protein [Solirubrobacteraceae bacterium]